MARYNTGNPIDSNAMKDLSDNAQNLDVLVNSKTALTQTDRLGVERKTWHGMEKYVEQSISFAGYVFSGGYASGVTLTSYNQIVRDGSGEFWRVSGSTDLPYTLTGAGVDEGGSLVSVGDAALRSDLEQATGASRVGYASGSVKSALDTALPELRGLSVSAPSINTVDPLLIDMHYGVLCGTGWAGSGELGGSVLNTAKTTAGYEAGAQAVTVNNSALFTSRQLICWEAVDGQWYSAVVTAISGSTLYLDRPLPVSVANNAPIIYFYADKAHPNQHGFKAICDYAVREVKLDKKLKAKISNYLQWTATTGATVASESLAGLGTSNLGYGVPGILLPVERGLACTVTAANAGCKSNYITLSAGNYTVELLLNGGFEASPTISNTLTVDVVGTTANGEYVLETKLIKGVVKGGVRKERVFFNAQETGFYYVRITSVLPSYMFRVGALHVYEINKSNVNINNGKHVILSDSWFSAQSRAQRIIDAYTNAEFVVSGVGGNNSQQLLDRFDADVAVHVPDYVWVMVGTNDYYQSVTTVVFKSNISKLAARIVALGAKPIFFNASVGDTSNSTSAGNVLPASRGYAHAVKYVADSDSLLGFTSHNFTSFGPLEAGDARVVAQFINSIPTVLIRRVASGYDGVSIGVGDVNDAILTGDVFLSNGSKNILYNAGVVTSDRSSTKIVQRNGSGGLLNVGTHLDIVTIDGHI